MKKENIVKVILCSVVAIIAIFAIMLKGFNSSNITEDVLKSLNEDISSLSSYVNKYSIPKKGKTEISANYKGAHGESFPKDFKFNYKLEGNTLYFSDEAGYTKLELDQRLVDLFNIFSNDFTEDILVAKDEKNEENTIKVSLDIDKINNYFNKEFKKAEMVINKKNAISKEIKDITLSLDDYIITIDKSNYKIMYNDEKVDVNIVKNGYSLAINDTVKMNVIFEKDVDKYNIIVDNYVYSLNISNNNVKFTANTRASIYNSIEAVFMGEEVNINKKKEVDIKNNPLTRYFAEME